MKLNAKQTNDLNKNNVTLKNGKHLTLVRFHSASMAVTKQRLKQLLMVPLNKTKKKQNKEKTKLTWTVGAYKASYDSEKSLGAGPVFLIIMIIQMDHNVNASLELWTVKLSSKRRIGLSVEV